MDELYGLIGYPLGHSFSAEHFNRKFEKEHISADYRLFPLTDIEELLPLIQARPNLKGLNVTMPYKEKVIALLDGLSDEARAIAAVNVIRIERKQEKVFLRGFNTDCIGFAQSLEMLLPELDKRQNNNKTVNKALIFGTGGASKAVYYALESLGIASVFVSRTPRPGQLSYSQIDDKLLNEYPILVNATPLGMRPNDNTCPDIPYQALHQGHLLFDLVYNPAKTLFLQKGEERGTMIKNGLEMCTLQAEAAWNIWNTNL